MSRPRLEAEGSQPLLPRLARRYGPALKTALNAADRRVHWRSGLEWLLEVGTPSHIPGTLPAGAEEALRPDHPRLVELRTRYRGHPAAAGSLWNDTYLSRELDLRYFRGDNVYVWQRRRHTCPASYALTAGYVRSHDELGLMGKLTEDGLFGAYLLDVDGKPVSRDLLDSVLELNFLHRHAGISPAEPATVLDIGAGYGRLAHRGTAAFENLEFLCTDGVAESTYLCEYYLRYREVSRALTVPLDEIEPVLGNRPIDVAVNVHGLEECPLEVARWWFDLLARHRVPWLLFVSVLPEPRTRERSGNRLALTPVLAGLGYELAVQQRKYAESQTVQELGVFPSHYFMYRWAG